MEDRQDQVLYVPPGLTSKIPTLCSHCVLFCTDPRTLRLLPHTVLTEWLCVTEVDSVYCAIRIESLYRTLLFVFKGTFAFAIRAFIKKQLVGVRIMKFQDRSVNIP